MESVGREIVAPNLAHCEAEFRTIIEKLFIWVADERK
jgi:hypothetical protein